MSPKQQKRPAHHTGGRRHAQLSPACNHPAAFSKKEPPLQIGQTIKSKMMKILPRIIKKIIDNRNHR
jgi:hypothetical protein